MKSQLLKKEEEQELGRRIKIGDSLARNILFEKNTKLAASIAKKYSRYKDIDDLLQEAYIGLLIAIDKYDPERGHKFSTYATWWIKQRVSLAAKETEVKISANIVGTSLKLYNAIQEYKKEFGENPTDEELISYLGISRQELAASYSAINARNVEKIEDHSDSIPFEIDYLKLDKEKITKAIYDAFDNLSSEQREALSIRYDLEIKNEKY